jgi:hypothetical protein
MVSTHLRVKHEEQGAALHELDTRIKLPEQLGVLGALVAFVAILGGSATFNSRHYSQRSTRTHVLVHHHVPPI